MPVKLERKFVRSNLLPGVWGTCHKKVQIQIKDRDIYCTSDPSLIKLFENDREIMEFKPGVGDDAPKVYSDMAHDELLQLAKDRGLEKDDVTLQDTDIEGLIKELKEWDAEESKPENDQGEQPPDKND